jgi:AcrR family transcriptional regulator
MSPAGTAPTPRTRLSAGERREAIMTAAKGVFGRVGYHEATTRDIAAAAGVSEGLLYQHFPGKRQLFMELVLTAAAELERRLQTASLAEDPAAASVAAYFDFVEEESELYRVFFRQAMQADLAIQRLSQEIWGRFVRLTQNRMPVSELGAHALAGMQNELALWWLEERRLTKAEMVERATRLGRAVLAEVCEETEGTDGTQESHGAAGP